MRFKSDSDDAPKTVSGETDPLLDLPEDLSEQVMNLTHDLTIFLGQRHDFFKDTAFSQGVKETDGMDYSACALIERLAFYETMMLGLAAKVSELDKKIGGSNGKN